MSPLEQKSSGSGETNSAVVFCGLSVEKYPQRDNHGPISYLDSSRAWRGKLDCGHIDNGNSCEVPLYAKSGWDLTIVMPSGVDQIGTFLFIS